MDEHINQQKMRDRIDDDNIYKKYKRKQIHVRDRKIHKPHQKLRKKNEDTFWLKLIEHHPKTPTLYELLRKDMMKI